MHQALTEGNDLRNASRMPFTNAPESSDENFFAKSTASFSTTFGGVSVALNSYIANRKIARSIAAKRSNRQFSACLTINSSSALISRAVPSNNRFANARVVSAAFAPFQNFPSRFVGSCSLLSHTAPRLQRRQPRFERTRNPAHTPV